MKDKRTVHFEVDVDWLRKVIDGTEGEIFTAAIGGTLISVLTDGAEMKERVFLGGHGITVTRDR